MGIFTPIVPLEFDASYSYIQRLMHLCEKLNEQGVSINTIQEFLNSLDIDKKIKDEVFKQFVNTPNLKRVLEHRKIMLVGDSYLAGAGLPDPSTQGFGHLLYELGFDITALASSGAGFTAQGANGRFLDVVRNWTQNRNDYTDIIF